MNDNDQKELRQGYSKIRKVFHDESLIASQRRELILEFMEQFNLSAESLTPAIRELIEGIKWTPLSRQKIAKFKLQLKAFMICQ